MATGTGGPQPSDASNLATAYSNLCLLLATVTANPQPSYSENGRSISWSEYVQMLTTRVSNAKDALLASLQASNGPFELVSRAKS